jgi:hypothetical protein
MLVHDMLATRHKQLYAYFLVVYYPFPNQSKNFYFWNLGLDFHLMIVFLMFANQYPCEWQVGKRVC